MGIKQDVVFEIILQSFFNPVIIIYIHALVVQVGKNAGRKFLFIDEQSNLGGRNKQIRHKYGIAMHITAPKVQHPSNIIERSHQHTVSMFLAQGTTNTRYLFMTRLPSVLQGLNEHRILRNGRTVFPDDGQRIEVCTKRDSALMAQSANQLLHLSG